MATATWKGVVIARTDKFETVEGNVYFPPDSLVAGHFTPSSHTSMCPWKGKATYKNVTVGGATNENAAWVYEAPRAAAANIKGHMAFWKGVQNMEGSMAMRSGAVDVPTAQRRMSLRSQMMALTLPTRMVRPSGCYYPNAPSLDDEEAGSGEWDADLTPVVPSSSNGSSGSRSGLGPMPRKRMWSGPTGGAAVPRSRPVSMVFGAAESATLDDVLPGGSYLGMDDALDEDGFDDYSSDEACSTAHLTRRSPQVCSPAIAIPRNDTGRPSAVASPIASGGSWVGSLGNDDAMEGEERDEPFVPPHLLSERLTQSLAAVPRRDIRHALANWA